MITQRAEETLTLPDDVAFTLGPNQMMRLELHYLNATESPQRVQVDSELRTLAGASIEADFLFIGTPDINLPSQTPAIEQTVGPTFIQLPAELQGVNVRGHRPHPQLGKRHRRHRPRPASGFRCAQPVLVERAKPSTTARRSSPPRASLHLQAGSTGRTVIRRVDRGGDASLGHYCRATALVRPHPAGSSSGIVCAARQRPVRPARPLAT
jgi:hypothetical protein